MLAVTMGICAVFDVTGAAVFRVVRPGLPQPPPRAGRPDPLQAAMATIMAAHREVIRSAGDQSGTALPP